MGGPVNGEVRLQADCPEHQQQQHRQHSPAEQPQRSPSPERLQHGGCSRSLLPVAKAHHKQGRDRKKKSKKEHRKKSKKSSKHRRSRSRSSGGSDSSGSDAEQRRRSGSKSHGSHGSRRRSRSLEQRHRRR